MAIISQKVGYKLREDLFDKIQKLPVKYFDQNSSGDLMSRFTNDVNNITDMFSQNSALILNGVVMILGMIISMFLLSPYLTIILLGLFPIMIFPVMILSKKSQPLFSRAQRTLGQVNGYIEEMISGQSVITLYDQSDKAIADFDKINKNLISMTGRGQSVSSVIMP
ncbi:ABC transporter ATP-binding protein [bacterium]|nr:ABC transporter ATP-binding protein [bacterium]MBR2652500.1 ABC transporter ATP-binding protein [bacterium]